MRTRVEDPDPGGKKAEMNWFLKWRLNWKSERKDFEKDIPHFGGDRSHLGKIFWKASRSFNFLPP